MKALSISLVVLAIILGATADGFNHGGRKPLGHALEALEKVALILSGLFSGTWLVLVSYIAFRASFFDYIRNISAGDPFFYVGTSSYWDGFLSKFPTHGVTFTRVIFLALAVSISLRYL